MKTITRVSILATLFFTAIAVAAPMFGKSAEHALIAALVWSVLVIVSASYCMHEKSEW